MGLKRTTVPTSWGRIGPECLNLTLPSKWTSRKSGPHLDQNVCWGSYAAVAPASILGLSGGLFSAAAGPGQRPLLYLAQTWHSKIEIRDENRK